MSLRRPKNFAGLIINYRVVWLVIPFPLKDGNGKAYEGRFGLFLLLITRSSFKPSVIDAYDRVLREEGELI